MYWYLPAVVAAVWLLRARNNAKTKGRPTEAIPRRSSSLKAVSSGWQAIAVYLSLEFYKNLVRPENLVRVARGSHALLSLIAELFHMNGGVEWDESKQVLQMGTIKNTKNYGNTSVAMGLAKLYFSLPGSQSQVGFLNCGQGGIKYQLYSHKNGIISVEEEHKPGGKADDVASFAKLNCGEFKVDAKQVMSKEQLSAKMAEEIKQAPWKKLSRRIPVYAFVTGELRNFFEPKDGEERKEVNELVNSVFKHATPDEIPVSVLLDLSELSYFISAERESLLETIGTNLMYEQANSATPNLKPLQVVMTVAMGRSTSQICQINVNGEMKHLNLSNVGGMDDSTCVNLGQALVEYYAANPTHLQEFIASIRNCQRRGRIPIIAPKSGCLLLLDQPSHPAHKALLDVLDPIIVRIGEPLSKKDYELKVGFGTSHAELCVLSSQILRQHKKEHVQVVEVRDAANTKDPIVCVTPNLQGKKLYVYYHQSVTHFGTGAAKKNQVASFEKLSDQLPPGWKTDSQNEDSRTIPFFWILDKWHLVKNREGRDQPAREKIWGTHSTLVMLKALASIDDVSWKTVVFDSLLIGFMKTTLKCGNSSVSMGLATVFFSDEKINKENSSIVVILNCGTGGIKIQVYTKLPQINGKQRIALLAEKKLDKGFFQDEEQRREARTLLLEEIKTGPWQSWGEKIDMYAFVTGPIRNEWEKGDANKTEEVRNVVNGVFETKDGEPHIRPVSELLYPGSPTNYLISNDAEGSLELSAQRFMYRQVNPDLCVVASISVEASSSRVTIIQSDKEDFDDKANHKVVFTFLGMKNNKGEVDVEKFLDVLREHELELINKFRKVVERCVRDGLKPVIAIKAGGTLMLEAEPELREQFETRPPSYFDRAANEGEQSNFVTLDFQNLHAPGFIEHAIPVPITSARLCAIAANRLLTPEKNFYHIFYKTAEGELMLFGEPDIKVNINILTLRDFLNIPANANGKKHLYFSSNRSVTHAPEVRPEVIELVCRAREICVDVREEQFVRDELGRYFNDDPEALAVKGLRFAEATLNRVLAHDQQWFEQHIEPYTPPPFGGKWDPNSKKLGAAIDSLKKKLPIGQYIKEMKPCLNDVIQEQTKVFGLDNAHLSANASGLEICKMLTDQFKDLCIHVIFPDMRTPKVFPEQSSSPSTNANIKNHMWIFSENEEFKSCASLWSPREIDEQEIWQCFRFRLQADQCDEKEKEKFFQHVARFWTKIEESKSPFIREQLKPRIKPRIRQLVDLHVLDILGRRRPRDEDEEKQGGGGGAQNFSFTADQWEHLRRNLVTTLNYGRGNREYLSEVCEAFHESVCSQWNHTVIQESEIVDWVDFYRIFFTYLSNENYERLKPKKEALRQALVLASVVPDSEPIGFE